MDYSQATIAFIAIIVGIITYSAYKMLGFGPNQFPVNGKVSYPIRLGGMKPLAWLTLHSNRQYS